MALNVRLLKQQIAQQAGQRIASRANEAIKLNFQVQKEQFLKAFDDHPVTQELAAGPDAFSSQSELAASGGNLFSLIGFNQEQEPTVALRQILDKSIKVDTNKKKVVAKPDGRLEISAPVTLPTLDDIYLATTTSAKTQVPWNKGRSFVQMIQKGIAGFGHFISGMFESPEPSRSGGGIQVGNKVRDTSLGPVPYLNELLADFKRSLSRKK